MIAIAICLLEKVSTHSTRLGEITEAVTILDGRSDEPYDEGLKDVLTRHGKADPMSYFIGSETYGQLEKVVDRFEDVANEIGGIVIGDV